MDFDMDFYGFYTGKLFDAYEYLGAHPTPEGTVFRTFAPGAAQISLIGDCNGWQETSMERVHDGNFWACTIPEAGPGCRYKYRIYKQDGTCLDHCDPYGFSMELRPHTASIVRDLTSYRFQDDLWLKRRSDCRDKPLNIYELHCGSWRKKTGGGWYTYAELGALLLPYLKENGYNYVELMPLNEYPCDESWGYQATGFFSPTSRYGTPEDLMAFVDACHQNGVGVLLDFVPVHFAVDDYALWNYDGSALYEYPHVDVGRSAWGSCNFMHSRGEVRSFLQSAAHYWLEEYHFDGLRMDAVNNLIYWQGDSARGENQGALLFLREMNTGLKKRHPTALLAAEDSSAYPGVTAPVEQGGLGFDYKWDMGWMNDTLSYLQSPPPERVGRSGQLAFSMDYFYRERYLLPLSHDEVVHGKASIVQKMSGADKLPQARLLYLYMFAHPGKKLNFMGNELGQLAEWDAQGALDWEILKNPPHDYFFHFIQALNRFYLDTPALWEREFDPEGFRWLDCGQTAPCTFAFERRGRRQRLLALFHFSDKLLPDYRLALPGVKKLTLAFATGEALDAGESEKTPRGGEAAFSLGPYAGRCYLVE